METLIVLGILGLTATLLFFYLMFFNKPSTTKTTPKLHAPTLHLFTIPLSIAIIAYIFRLIIMFLTGLSASFIIPTIITSIIAILPLFIILLITKKYQKEEPT